MASLALIVGCASNEVRDAGTLDARPASDVGGRRDKTLPRTESGVRSCDQLRDLYVLALNVARRCDLRSTAAQCTTKVSDQLPCPCPTLVNAANTRAMTELAELSAEWTASKCTQGGGCPPMPCGDPPRMICEADGAGGGICKPGRQ